MLRLLAPSLHTLPLPTLLMFSVPLTPHLNPPTISNLPTLMTNLNPRATKVNANGVVPLVILYTVILSSKNSSPTLNLLYLPLAPLSHLKLTLLTLLYHRRPLLGSLIHGLRITSLMISPLFLFIILMMVLRKLS